MYEILVPAAIFFCLVAASLGSLVVSQRLPARYRHDDAHNVIRLAANIFVGATSLVLGLLLNSSRSTFESVDRNVHAFATELILLDRSLRHYGPEAAGIRRQLAAYVRQKFTSLPLLLPLERGVTPGPVRTSGEVRDGICRYARSQEDRIARRGEG